MTSSERAAREWFGYGTWTAPYWFVGMEPGGEGDGASHESWERLGGGELIDCRAHHLDCDFTRSHGLDRPPTQPTWRRLIQLLLSYMGESTDLDAVARYQRDRLGASGDETAIIELSARHAVNMDVDVARRQHRDERIALIGSRLREHAPSFVVFYGRSYQVEYERVIGGPFGSGDAVWRGLTLCVLTPHPVAKSGPPPEFWTALGRAMRSAVDAGPSSPLAPVGWTPASTGTARSRKPAVLSSASNAVVSIMRGGEEAGRIVRAGPEMRVEAPGQRIVPHAGPL
jgi:hypothetical protein